MPEYFQDLAGHPLLGLELQKSLATIVRQAVLSEVEEMVKYPLMTKALLARDVATIAERAQLMEALNPKPTNLAHQQSHCDPQVSALQVSALLISNLAGQLGRDLFDRLRGDDRPGETLADLRDTFAEIVACKTNPPAYHAQLVASAQKIDHIRTKAEPARAELIASNLRLVLTIARNYVGCGLPFEDLVSAGNLGLMRGVDGFNPAKGFSLSTYVNPWIKQSIVREIHNTATTVRIPSNARMLLGACITAVAQIKREEQREPSDEEIAKLLGVSNRVVKAVRWYVRNQSSYGDEPTDDLMERRICKAGTAPEDRAQDSMHDYLKRAIPIVLGHKDARVFSERAIDPSQVDKALLRPNQKTLHAMGVELGLTRERVRQIHESGRLVAQDLVILRQFSMREIDDAAGRAQFSPEQFAFLDNLTAAITDIGDDALMNPLKEEEISSEKSLQINKRGACLTALVAMLLIQKQSHLERTKFLEALLPTNLNIALTLVSGAEKPCSPSIILQAIYTAQEQKESKSSLSVSKLIQSALCQIRPKLVRGGGDNYTD